MPKVMLIEDEEWPVWKVFDPDPDRPRHTFDVPVNQLEYWRVVEQEWRRVQRQMATVTCAAANHEKYTDKGPCLTCNPPAEPLV